MSSKNPFYQYIRDATLKRETSSRSTSTTQRLGNTTPKKRRSGWRVIGGTVSDLTGLGIESQTCRTNVLTTSSTLNQLVNELYKCAELFFVTFV